jgi:hypothetical protein
MKHYKDPKTNEIFAFESDGSDDEFIPAHLVSITDKEADQIRKAQQEEAFNSLSYADKRLVEYPPMADYLDGVVKGDQKQIDAYIAACLKVKEKHPKPE